MTQQTLYRRLRDMRDQFTPPPGLAWPEISDGKIVMMMSPGPRHQLTATHVRNRITPQLPDDWGVFGATDTDDELLGKLRVPDLHVCSYDAMQTDDPLDPLDPHEIVLAIEIVSPSNPDNDYRDKSRDYPAMGIPHYLILDPRDGTWTYRWSIGKTEGRSAYENRLHLPYGAPVTLVAELGTWSATAGRTWGWPPSDDRHRRSATSPQSVRAAPCRRVVTLCDDDQGERRLPWTGWPRIPSMGGTMTAEPLAEPLAESNATPGCRWPVPPRDGYTVDDLFTLPDLPPHTELIDGSLVFVSPQRYFHSTMIDLLMAGLRRTVPRDRKAVREMTIVLDRRNGPEPDISVVRADAVTGREQTRFQAADVLLAVEVVLPDSESRDRDTKPHKYAAAGIPHFWLVETGGGAGKHPVVRVYELDPVSKTYDLTGTHRELLKLGVPYDIDVDITSGALDEF